MTQILGWAGSALLVYSLLQTRVLRFRALNLVAALVLVLFNALVGVWPMVAMNVVIAGINVWHVLRLLRTRHDHRHYDVVPVGADEPYLRHLLALHRDDIERFNPGVLHAAAPSGLTGVPDSVPEPLGGADVAGPPDPTDRLAFLVLSRGETVGVLLAHRTADGAAQVDLDYVLPRFRDFTPGEFVYRPDGPLAGAGVRRVVAPPGMRQAERYLSRVGFRPSGADLVLELG